MSAYESWWLQARYVCLYVCMYVCLYVCMSKYVCVYRMSFAYLENRSSNLLHTWQVYCWGPKDAMVQFGHLDKFTIN